MQYSSCSTVSLLHLVSLSKLGALHTTCVRSRVPSRYFIFGAENAANNHLKIWQPLLINLLPQLVWIKI